MFNNSLCNKDLMLNPFYLWFNTSYCINTEFFNYQLVIHY